MTARCSSCESQVWGLCRAGPETLGCRGWQIAFDATARRVFVDRGIDKLMRMQERARATDWQATLPLDGFLWQLSSTEAALVPGVDWDGGAFALENGEQGRALGAGLRLILIFDPSDYGTVKPFMDNLKVGGHWIWPRATSTAPMVTTSDFAAGLYDAQMVLLFLSSACEISP